MRYIMMGGVIGFTAANVRAISLRPEATQPSADVSSDPPPRSDSVSSDPEIERFVDRIENSFREIYLTIIGIVQGVALGYLAITIVDDYQTLGVDRRGRIVGIILFFLICWQEYMVGSCAFSWVPTILDSIAPFLLGLAEFFVIAAIERPLSHYLFFSMILYGMGIFAALNYYFQTRRYDSALNKTSRTVVDAHPRACYKLSTGCFLFLLGLWLLTFIPELARYGGLISWTSTLPGLVFAVSIIPRWDSPISAMLRTYGVKLTPFDRGPDRLRPVAPYGRVPTVEAFAGLAPLTSGRPRAACSGNRGRACTAGRKSKPPTERAPRTPAAHLAGNEQCMPVDRLLLDRARRMRAPWRVRAVQVRCPLARSKRNHRERSPRRPRQICHTE
jgi:hypothetical protein